MKGIAVSTLAMLIIGMIVLAIVGYLVYRTFVGGGGKQFSEEDCKVRIIAICSNCRMCASTSWGSNWCPPQNPTDTCNIACKLPSGCSETVKKLGFTSCSSSEPYYAGFYDCNKTGMG